MYKKKKRKEKKLPFAHDTCKLMVGDLRRGSWLHEAFQSLRLTAMESISSSSDQFRPNQWKCRDKYLKPYVFTFYTRKK